MANDATVTGDDSPATRRLADLQERVQNGERRLPALTDGTLGMLVRVCGYACLRMQCGLAGIG